MPPRVLYQRLCQQLRACAPQFGVWHRQRLALLVTGLLLARHPPYRAWRLNCGG
jgi:hypothetical protein